MSVRDHFTLVDIPCDPAAEDCEITMNILATSNGATVAFKANASTTCAGGMTTNFPTWTFKIGTETFGPVHAGNAAATLPTITLTQGAAAGSILTVDWSDFNSPILGQQNELQHPIRIQGFFSAQDDCGCSRVKSAWAGMVDDVLIPPPLLMIRTTGDVSAVNVPGLGTDLATSSAGEVIITGQVYDYATGAVPTGPTAGCTLIMQLYDSLTGQDINTLVFDYSATIDFVVDLPTSESSPIFTRADGSQVVLTWAIIQSYISAGSDVDGSGVLTIVFDKGSFVQDYDIRGCFSTDPGNSVELEFIFSMSCTGTSTSPTSTARNPRIEVLPRIVSPIGIALESQTGMLYFNDTGGGFSELRELDPATGCITTVNEVNDFTAASATGTLTYNDLIADTSRQVGGRDVLYLTNADGGAGNHSLLQLTWNVGTASWDVVELLVSTGIGGIRSIDYNTLVNGRPILVGGFFGNMNVVYWTGVGDVYAMTVVSGVQMGTSNGCGHTQADPVASEIYNWAGSAGPGTQRWYRVGWTADPTVATNWSGTRLGILDRYIDVDGQLSTTIPDKGHGLKGGVYIGIENGQPAFVFPDNSYNKLKKFRGVSGGSGAPGEWEVITIAGDGTSATTDGTGVAAQTDNPNGICYDSAANVLYFTEALGKYIRKMDLATDEVTTLHSLDLTSGIRDTLYF